MSEEDAEEAKAKKEAEAAKKKGSDAYKKRDFVDAAKLFEKAWEIWPKDITYLTNAGGTSFLRCIIFPPRDDNCLSCLFRARGF